VLPGLAERKRRLRKSVGARRRNVPGEVAATAARMIAAQLATAPEIAEAGVIGLYAALPDELPTRVLFESLRRQRHECVFPRVQGRRSLVFHRVDAWEELRPAGRLGIAEPSASAPAYLPGPRDVVLVPGVAFDEQGNRLGRGAGYYDAAFPPGAASPPLLFGVAYEFQIVDSVPHGSRDRRVDAIVTERTIRRIGGA
jgi:5-formyltetrahydrofolate cyclo-ligase